MRIDRRTRSLESTCTKCLDDQRIEVASCRRPGPRLVHKLREPDLPVAAPWILGTRNHNQRLLEKHLQVDVVLAGDSRCSKKAELNITFTQLIIERGPTVYRDVKDRARIPRPQAIDDSEN